MIDLVFPDSCRKSMDLQVQGDDECYKTPTFFMNELLHACKITKPETVLELGCGIGRGSMFLFKSLRFLMRTKFYLVDGNSGDIQIGGIQNSSSDFYNRENATRDFCTVNGLTNFEFINAENPVWPAGVKFDFVFSMASIGFHWPISIYLDKIAANLKPGAILMFQSRSIFDPRSHDLLIKWNADQVQSIKDSGRYKLVKFVDDTDSSYFLIERI